MPFLLNSHNVFEYLVELGLCNNSEQATSKVELVVTKNFDLLVTLSDSRKLLVKQERHKQGKAAGEFLGEWVLKEFLQRFSELNHLRLFLPEVLHFDLLNSIIVQTYRDDYRDLSDFYQKENSFNSEIATAIGTIVATIHRDTFNRPEYEEFFHKNSSYSASDFVKKAIGMLERISPEIFGLVPDDGLKFFALYQRYDDLGQAIAQLGSTFTTSCLTHNDLKLNNILLHSNWQQNGTNIIQLIDWEFSAWGDPAMDLGNLIGSYVFLWLGSLVISKSLSLEESLGLAITPMDLLQPSIVALASAYEKTFPEIFEHRPDFWLRVVQFVGFALILQILSTIQHQKSFSNTGIAMMQVAKTLLCNPQQSMRGNWMRENLGQ
ncbi:aminoglycoside phosphotransferase family protein [Tolypothrix sp. VBCCA 56010]|uniref:aminoglycoside phosphotransferase family protein n=1 Tax=Tolypothrix sp. VBCCA 56010 TaxID=3137731 RepID=UPI003D7E42D2